MGPELKKSAFSRYGKWGSAETASVQYDTRKRISAEASLRHSYFLSLGENIHSLADTSSVFSQKEVQLQKDPGHRSSVFHPGRGKNRRQSIF